MTWRDTPETIVLGHIEWLALLYVPMLAAYDQTPLDIPAVLEALARGEALLADEQRHKDYEPARMHLLWALATVARLPGGYTFGRLHFGDFNGRRRSVSTPCTRPSALSTEPR